jgi:hypothetical protein
VATNHRHISRGSEAFDQCQAISRLYKVLLVPVLLHSNLHRKHPSSLSLKFYLGKIDMPVFSRIAVFAQFFSIILSPVIAASVSQEYDYVIVGGGITGLVVANRLSEDKNSTSANLANDLMLTFSPCRVYPRDREW